MDLLTEAIRLESSQPNYFVNRAAIHTLINDYDGAIADLEIALELDPKHIKAHMVH